jgi:hypothetical protein
MSLYGAMRLFIHGAVRPTPGPMPRPAEPDGDAHPIRPGAWAAWAAARQPWKEDEEEGTGATFVLPEGRIGGTASCDEGPLRG